MTYTEMQYIRDTIKEALEADDMEDVRDELKECLNMLEAEL